MPRHKLSAEERKIGVLKALESKKTPRRLRPGLRSHAKKRGWV